jgi:5-methylcytosine-specific restriction endonuclease McrA
LRIQEHLKLSGAAAVVALPWLKQDVWIPFVASIGIDVDHYLWHAVTYRTLSLRAAIRYFRQADPPQLAQQRLFHQPVFLGTLFFVAAWTRSRLLWLILAGFVFHVGLDAIHVTQMRRLKRTLSEEAEYMCPECGQFCDALQLHTVSYPRNVVDRYNVAHFVVLCGDCHARAHG